MCRFFNLILSASALLALALVAPSAGAACLGAVANGQRPALLPAAFTPERVQQPRSGELRLTFVGHSTFLLESPSGVRAATDYNDYIRPAVVPDIITMNHAHGTHYTDSPDPGIRHVLRGWAYQGKPARHNLTYRDMRVRNVPTNLRGFSSDTEYDGNSIFIFDAADLCVAHLGHLHHPLTPGHLADLGRIDVLLVPVDGGYTLNQAQMRDVIRQVQAPLVIPMHYFGETTLERFLTLLRDSHDIKLSDTATILLSRPQLPKRPTVMVLPGPH